MKKIIISPWSRNLPGERKNAKNFHRWQQVVKRLRDLGFHVIQIGVKGEEIVEGVNEIKFNLPFKELKDLVRECDSWISVDNFMNHFGAWMKRPGVVIFGKSDPDIFGHPENKNLLKNRRFLRDDQFLPWGMEKHDSNVFVSENEVIEALLELLEIRANLS